MEAYYLIEDWQWNDGEGLSYVSMPAGVLPVIELEYELHLLTSLHCLEESVLVVKYF